MTVVVGVRGKDGVVLAADTAGTAGYDQREREDGKTFVLSPLVAIGFTTSYRMGQILRYDLSLPKLPLGSDEYEWAVKDFVPAARAVLKSGGFAKVSEGVERGGTFLLAVRNRLFAVEDDFQVAEDSVPWATCGSGGSIAAGHLAGLVGAEREDSIDDGRIEGVAVAAVESARTLNAGVGGRITSVRTIRFTDAERAIARTILGKAA